MMRIIFKDSLCPWKYCCKIQDLQGSADPAAPQQMDQPSPARLWDLLSPHMETCDCLWVRHRSDAIAFN